MRAQMATHSDSSMFDWLRYRHLLWSLTWRDIRVRYKQSLLGVAWAILMPLSMMMVFTFVFTRAIQASSLMAVDMPYALFAYTGLVPWTFFSMSLMGCVNSLVANRNLVTKVYFPREVFPLSCVASGLVDFGIAMSVLVALMGYFHMTGEWEFVLHPSLLFVPVIVLVQVLFTIGLGMLLGMANLFYRDVRQIAGVGVQLLMFVSAVVVPVPKDDSILSLILSLNPLVPLIGAYRDCIVYGHLPAAGGFLYACATAMVFFVCGWMIFRRASYRFAECI